VIGAVTAVVVAEVVVTAVVVAAGVFGFVLFLSFVCEKALVPRHANKQNVSKYFTNC
jgi:multisubunit Na+/H+ antiporter MnhC subunit